ncbi:hypothetical protein TH3_15425 [Thalassospira xiamenensis M-5 = DSM 17429]|uniref:Uncharacterized protein n=1 Tax=Thalassospira xiamenensis M-5 = DSM 17429 TaxID=1123366 RepID=A0AB72UGI9_9PROT|nr:hypothetical protein TH3_15425 [Thalassospira xiamenensis M-5 = DSM 17429]
MKRKRSCREFGIVTSFSYKSMVFTNCSLKGYCGHETFCETNVSLSHTIETFVANPVALWRSFPIN